MSTTSFRGFCRLIASILVCSCGAQAAMAQSYPQQGYSQPGYSQRGYPQQAIPQPSIAALPTMANVPAGQTAMMDINGFDNPVPAFTFSRPTGWRVDEATIAWSEQPCAGLVPMSRLRLSSPDGAVIQAAGEQGWLQGMQQMAYSFQQRGIPIPPAFQNCPDAPATSAGDFLYQALASSRPGMQVVSSRQRNDFVQKMLDEIQRTDPQRLPQNRVGPYNPQIDAAEMVITYDGPDGPMEEVAMTGLVAVNLMPGSPYPAILQVTSGIISMSAPKGKLNRSALDQLWLSLKPLPAYETGSIQKLNTIGQMQAQAMRQWQQQAAARAAAFDRKRRANARLLSKTTSSSGSAAAINSSILDSSHTSFMSRSKASDRGQTGIVDTINETTTVYDPYNGYDVAVQGTGVDIWQTQTGSIFTTDQSIGYDPASEGVTATRLPPVSTGSTDSSWIWQ